MFGLVSYRAAETPPLRVIDGVRFRAVYVPEGASLCAGFAARAAAAALRRDGVSLALFPSDYPFAAPFARRGIVPPPLSPLYRAAAPALVRRYLALCGVDPRAATVAFAAARVTPELRRCVLALCREIRYIALYVPDGGDALARSLWRGFGAAARGGAPDAIPRPDLTVVFDDTPVPGEALRLDEALAVTFDSPHPNATLALLHRAGALDADSLNVKTLTRKPV